MEAYRSGHNEAVLKTVWVQAHGGSNPSASAIKNRQNDSGDFFMMRKRKGEGFELGASRFAAYLPIGKKTVLWTVLRLMRRVPPVVDTTSRRNAVVEKNKQYFA